MASPKLQTYDAKRNFTKTREPAGNSVAAVHTQPRFVIQKHAARRLHYDLRLEIDGVFKSWAVTRGPSLNPADKRLAVEVEDHPLAYGDFEGTIPAGEYGGGTVQLWDRGYWRPDEAKQPAASLRAGELKFTLHGERLKGSWVLVRMRHDRYGDKRNNWLLIKHGDSAGSKQKTKQLAAASEALLKEDRSVASGRSMQQIAAGAGPKPTPFMLAKVHRANGAAKSPIAMVEVSAATRARRKLSTKKVARMPAFIEPQLCKLVQSPPSGDDWVHEIKFDGYRLQLRVAAGNVSLKTRKGLDWTAKFPAVTAAAEQLPDCIIDGELVALDKQQHSSFTALQAALAERNTAKLVFFAFDLLFVDGKDLRTESLLQRKQQLQQLLSKGAASNPIRYTEHVEAAGHDVWQSACKLQLEGIISKRGAAAYSSGRGGEWTKTKCRAGHEVVIGGWTSDAGQVRSLLVGVMRNKHLVYVGRVGTGFGASNSRQLLPALKKATIERNPFHGVTAPRKESNVQWLKPKLVAEIEFAGWTGNGMVRQAAFKGLRADKPAAEVKAEVAAPTTVSKATTKLPIAKPQPAIHAKSAKSTANITLTHPDKLLWPKAGPEQGASKQDLAEYFAEVASWMLEHIKGRPCSLLRAPDGIQGEQFFQRHAMVGHSSVLKTIKVAGDRKPYLHIDSEAALIAVAQLAGIELHPWNCLPGKPEIPGRLVFDLDPAPELDFKRVIKAALELRDRLQQLGLESFCKTTGGKGLHVVVPLASRSTIDWRSTKLFAQTLCAQMASDEPSSYLINMSKAARKGRIFLDYLRNDRMATAVAPLSPRARAEAPVSMPLLWTQVRTGLEPMRFTIRSAAALLKQHQPWSDYQQAAGSLVSAAKKLLKTEISQSRAA